MSTLKGRFVGCLIVSLLILVAPLAPCGAEDHPELLGRFSQRGAEGCFVLLDLATGEVHRVHPDRAAERFLPASTFKIVNALIALETGVVEGPEELFLWDGKDRGSPGWNSDQTLATAFRRSSIWVFQEIARRVGEERMQAWVTRLGYGNEDLSGGLDRFWLTGGLRISAQEQVELLSRLVVGELPVSRRAVAEVRRMMLLEETPSYLLYGKTGWARRAEGDLGWFVGWVEHDEKSHIFALNVEGLGESFDLKAGRRELAEILLRDLGVLPAPSP